MKKCTIVLLLTLLSAGFLQAQTAITTDGSEPDGSAMLEIKSSEKGVLLPRMTQAAMAAIDNPANGLTVFNSTDNAFYIYNATDEEWKEIAYGNGTIEPKRCIIGSGDACSNTSVAGSYFPGEALSVTETVTIEVNVINTGDYSITSNQVNGYSFSASGTFSILGTQEVILFGSGMPVAAQEDEFTATASNNGGTCTFSVEPTTHAIGDSYLGGIVAYILQPDDPGYVEGEYRGLIAAETDQSTGDGTTWGCWGTELSGADGSEIGTGAQNTIDIETGCDTEGIAADICANLSLNGYDDWHLPSRDELQKMYENKVAIGGFTDDYYWSSTETSENLARRLNFTDGDWRSSSKTFIERVRAVRVFPAQNFAPVAYDVTYNGDLEVGETLTGSYSYYDFENDSEGTSTFQWYRADDATGNNQSAISGATAETYVLAAADVGKYISFEVTPIAATGNTAGNPVMSDFDGPVAFVCGYSLVDTRESKSYTTIEIGDQCWMAENLNIGTRIDGTQEMTDNSIIEKYCYNDNLDNCDIYGGLYQWNEMMAYSSTQGVQGICPDGWHLPTDAQWITMEEGLGMCTGTGTGCSGATGWRGTNQGSQIAGNADLWDNGNLDQNPDFGESGFNALPGGRRMTDGTYDRITSHAYFWSSSEDLPSAWRRALSYFNSKIARGSDDKSSGFSVRCLRD